MAHFIFFLLKTSHLIKYHNVCFTIFGAQKQKIWFLQDCTESGIWIKEEGNSGSLTGGPTCLVRLLPPDRDEVHQRFLRNGVVSGQTKGTNVIQNPSEPIDPLFLTVEPPEGACRRLWWLDGGARRYAGVLRSVERALKFPTTPMNYGKAFSVGGLAWNDMVRDDHERTELRWKHGGASRRVRWRWAR